MRISHEEMVVALFLTEKFISEKEMRAKIFERLVGALIEHVYIPCQHSPPPHILKTPTQCSIKINKFSHANKRQITHVSIFFFIIAAAKKNRILRVSNQ